MTSSDFPNDRKRPAARERPNRTPIDPETILSRIRAVEWIRLPLVQKLVATVDDGIRPFVAAHRIPAGYGIRIVLGATGPVSETEVDACAGACIEAMTSASNISSLYWPHPISIGHLLATARIVWDTLCDWDSEAVGEHVSAVRLTTILDSDYRPVMGGQKRDHEIAQQQRSGQIARDDLASMHWHKAALPPATRERTDEMLQSIPLPELTVIGNAAGETYLQEHILGNKGPRPSVGLGADYAAAFSVLARAQEEYGRRIVRSILADYLRSLAGAPIGTQSGLRESTATERQASGLRIEDGAAFTHTLARLLFSLETAIVCTKCNMPAYADWFRDRFRFRHSANRGGKSSIHGNASILPILKLTRLDLYTSD